VHLDLPALGLPDDPHHHYTVTDELDGTTYTWSQANYVYLDPRTRPAHVLTFQRNEGRVRAGGSRSDGSMAGADGTTARSRRSAPRPAARNRRRPAAGS
ncbi:hypothetical protein, partial [Actinomadura monticuli]